jgi:CCR4-NOT transcriptional regulation complex NOT5 subunit
MKKKQYEPIKEQLLVLVEYVDILERKKGEDRDEIFFLIEMIDTFKRQAEIYLNFLVRRQGNFNG